MNSILVAVIGVSSVWVYLDASKHRIGKLGGKGFFNLSAGGWGVVTMMLWIVGFPSYLIKRSGLKATAEDMPVTSPKRGLKAAGLGFWGGLWVMATLAGAPADLPTCDSTESQAVLKQIITSMPELKTAGVQFVTVNEIVEQGVNEAGTLRSCGGAMVTTGGKYRLQFSIKWQDQATSQFYVEAKILPTL